MNLHKILSTVPPQWRSVATHYARTFDRAGVPADKIDHLIQWGLQYEGSGDEAELLGAFRQQATRLGLDEPTTALAADWGLEAREEINSGMWQPEAPAQQDENGKLLADIRAFRAQWPDDYSQDHDMQALELRLIDNELGNAPAPASAAKPEPGKFAVSRGSRMDEIRQIMRDDPDSYNSNKALQAEQLSLIEAQIASRPAEAPAAAPPAQASEGNV
ncbi:hypothetical protein IVB45_18585 [Bradyrhizobium sp. 4]|uniref:hypothetical protein n=1 Tax=unclassified Bradyrhizobium TaxID=2631580 RepID=UPI001FF9D643|nr:MULTISPECIES: hypothetical protein [unclassified Bradyrhizobium]MCK1400129.1 hypothetical protein [Bradyrhizobium sp. 39]MCK1750419.1 hypothetical protein [Bradyrhizobium sp. 135]UPJ32028.1 hypothetical protein IVB45_18585 [Bradyrhizobium sp. 4]